MEYLEGIPSEIMLWIRAKMQATDSLDEVMSSIKKKFPAVGPQIDPEKVKNYILGKDPNWGKEEKLKEVSKSKPKIPKSKTAFEEEVEGELEKLSDWDPEKEFGKDEKERLDMLHGHRLVLSELWGNYVKIREGRQDAYKKGYLEAVAKELNEIQKLESAERDLMSALEEVRRAEEAETPEKVLDSILGWKIKRLIQKCLNEKIASEMIDRLSIELLNISIDLKIGADKEKAIARLEKRLYDTGFEKPIEQK